MFNPQSRISQYANSLPSVLPGSMDIVRPVQSSAPGPARPPKTVSQPPQIVRGSTSTTGQAVAKSTTSSATSYVEFRSKRSNDVHKVEKLYVGLLRELPPPAAVQAKWDEDVRTELENHLCLATSQLSQYMPDREVMIEPVLCMAGKKCSITDVTVPVGTACPQDPVKLTPTVWIYCGSKKCRKKVDHAIKRLAYLNHFVRQFGLVEPYTSLQGPWPSGRDGVSTVSVPQPQEQKISFAIQWPSHSIKTICGLRVRFTIGVNESAVKLDSTMGGLVIVDDTLYGLTTAHGIVAHILDSRRNVSMEDSPSDDEDSVLAESDSDYVSDSGSDLDPSAWTPVQVPEDTQVIQTEIDSWVELQLPQILAYLDHGTEVGDYNLPLLKPMPKQADFVLVPLKSFDLTSASNLVCEPEDDAYTSVDTFIRTSDLVSGEVRIIVGTNGRSERGYLLEGNASLILRGTVMRTKKIQVNRAGSAGLSGAWVIRDGKLCGTIYAAYDRSPYLHMLPAEATFQDVNALLPDCDVRVATAEDCSSKRAGMKEPETNPSSSRQTRLGFSEQEMPSPGFALALPMHRLTVLVSEAHHLPPSRAPFFVSRFRGAEYISRASNPAWTRGFRSNELAKKLLKTDKSNASPIPMGKRRASGTQDGTDDNRNADYDGQDLGNPKWEELFEFDLFAVTGYLDLQLYDGAIAQAPLGHTVINILQLTNQTTRFKLQMPGNRQSEEAATAEISVSGHIRPLPPHPLGPEDFESLKLIGNGQTGQTYLVRKKDTRQKYTMKVVSKRIGDEEKIIRALSQRKSVRSPFVVDLVFAFATPSDFYLFTEYKSGGELFWYLMEEHRFDEARAKYYVAEMVLAYQAFHERGIVVRGLKPENILLDANGHISICDAIFSGSSEADETDSFANLTQYLAPEFLLEPATATFMAYFWSLGVLLFEMCCGWSPFYAEETSQMYRNIAYGKIRFPRDRVSAAGKTFIKALLNRNPKHRIGHTPEEIKGHAFFSDIDWDALACKNIPPPFIPKFKSDAESFKSDGGFPATNDTLIERDAAVAKGQVPLAGETLVSHDHFAGSTFVDDNHDEFKGFAFDDGFTIAQASDGQTETVDEDGLRPDWDKTVRREDRMSGVVPHDDHDIFGHDTFDL